MLHVKQRPAGKKLQGVVLTDLPFYMAAFIIFADDKLVVDFLFEFGDMGDNADQLIAGREAFEDFDGLTA